MSSEPTSQDQIEQISETAETEQVSDAAPQSSEATSNDAKAEAPEETATRGGSSGRRAELEHEGDVAADFLESLLDIADLDGDLEVNVEGDRAAVSIVDSEDGPAPKRLVGADGVVLEALQELTRLAVQAETGDRSRLMLDIAGHRAGRREELVALARAATDRVKESGEREELEPMSAFERKVVHDEVLAAGLASESDGAEPHRYVVIMPRA